MSCMILRLDQKRMRRTIARRQDIPEMYEGIKAQAGYT